MYHAVDDVAGSRDIISGADTQLFDQAGIINLNLLEQRVVKLFGRGVARIKAQLAQLGTGSPHYFGRKTNVSVRMTVSGLHSLQTKPKGWFLGPQRAR